MFFCVSANGLFAMVYEQAYTIVEHFAHQKLLANLSLKVRERDKFRAEVMSRYAQSRNVSDFLRPGIEAFLDREQKRLGLSDEQIERDWATISGEKKGRRKASGE